MDVSILQQQVTVTSFYFIIESCETVNIESRSCSLLECRLNNFLPHGPRKNLGPTNGTVQFSTSIRFCADNLTTS